MPKRRYAIMTWNNYPTNDPREHGALRDEWDSILQSACDRGDLFTWCVGQPEVGASGTRHIQALVYHRDGLNFKKICDEVKGCVLKAYNDDWLSMKSYVTKVKSRDGDSFEFGVAPEGSGGDNVRPKLEKKKSQQDFMMEDIMGGELTDEKAVMEKYGATWLRTYKGVAKALELSKEAPKPCQDPDEVMDQQIFCYWLYGDAGLGKSRRARKMCFKNGLSLFVKEGETGQWWDGYRGEKAVLLDDFRPWNMKFSSFLRLVDPYRSVNMTVQVKGGTVQLKATHFFITCPEHPINFWKCTREKKNDW